VRGKFGVTNGMLIRSDDTHTHTHVRFVHTVHGSGGR
jgi:hypothetical protein